MPVNEEKKLEGLESKGMIRPDWLEEMSAPIPANEIEWKQKTTTDGKKGTYALFVTYFTARHAIRVLNRAFGRYWSESHEAGEFIHEFERVPNNGAHKGKLTKQCYNWKCTITVKDAAGTFSRNGYANSADIEPTKSAASNSLKRAVSKFGFGLELYDFPKVYVECTGGGKKYAPAMKVMKKAFDKIYKLYQEGSAEEKYFIDSKGKLFTFSYGWKDRSISITTGKTLPKKEAPKKEAPKAASPPDLIAWPMYSDKPNSSWEKIMEAWDGNINDNKAKDKKIIVMKKGNKTFYYFLTPAQFQILCAHIKHGDWISKVQADAAQKVIDERAAKEVAK